MVLVAGGGSLIHYKVVSCARVVRSGRSSVAITRIAVARSYLLWRLSWMPRAIVGMKDGGTRRKNLWVVEFAVSS